VTPKAASVVRVPRTYGDGKGLEFSLGRFFQDLLIQGNISNGSLESRVFLFELLQPFRLVEVESTVRAAPSVIRMVCDTNITYRLAKTLAACNGNFDLPEFVEHLFRAMSFSWHFCLPSINQVSDLSTGYV